MIWQGEALIINAHKHSESALIVTFFAREEGVFSAYVRGALSKRNSPIYQIGNMVAGIKKSRSENGLGSFSKAEIVRNYNAKYLASAKKILALKTITEMLSMSLQAGEEYLRLYDDTIGFLDNLISNDLEVRSYIEYELTFLSDIGFGIDLSSCSVTGKKDGLFYVSPNTGHSVTEEVGKPYHNKLLIIPEFLKDTQDIITKEDCQKGFKLTGHFLAQNLFNPLNRKIPYSRDLLVKELLK